MARLIEKFDGNLPLMDTFNPLDHPLCFQVPDRIDVLSAWYEHTPFAFYLMEIARPKCLVELGTHNGASLLAFCKAVQALLLDTKCYAIDTWKGDKMAGFYDQEVFEGLSEYHDSHYSKFSSLLRMTFDEGATNFSESSVDLLHIDGFHTYEAVKHDFEKWLSKLTPNAIVLFHDTNVHENDFGVWKFWEELKKRYTSFEFYHGYGLGVLTLAKSFPQGLRFDNTSPSVSNFRDFFAALGKKNLLENSLLNSKRELEILRKQIESFNTTDTSSKEILERATQGKTNTGQVIQRLEMDLAAEKANCEHVIQKLEMDLATEKANSKQLIQRLEMNIASEKASLAFEYHLLEQEINAQISRNSELIQSLNFANREIVEYYNSTSWKITRPLRWIGRKLRGNNA